MEKNNNIRYVIECNENQLTLLIHALEDYARLRMGQNLYMADSVAWDGYEYKKGDPEFNERIEVRDRLEEKFKEIADILQKVQKYQKSDDTETVIDMWRVLRHIQWKQSDVQSNIWDVRSHEPEQFGPEPLIKAEVIEEKAEAGEKTTNDNPPLTTQQKKIDFLTSSIIEVNLAECDGRKLLFEVDPWTGKSAFSVLDANGMQSYFAEWENAVDRLFS